MSDLPYAAFDADNHYYEAEDAFTRHMDPKLAKRAMQWADVDGRRCLLVGGKVNRFIPNPTFDPVAKPGCLDDYYQGKNEAGKSIRDAFGELVPIDPCYRDRDARIKVMDEQGIAGAFFFPTLGVGMEEALWPDVEAVHAAFSAFNRWLLEDWGFAYQERIYGAPYISLLDREKAIAELDWALENDVRLIVMRAAPIRTPGANRSPADPYFDPFWARINEAGITVAYHGGDAGYGRYLSEWGEGGEVQSFKSSPFRGVGGAGGAPFDLMAALVCHGLFERFTNLRLASIEMGAFWVPWLIQSLQRSYGMTPKDFPEDPVETFKRHVTVSPFHEDNVGKLKDLLGYETLLMGSDWPHAEGLEDPSDYVRELGGFSDSEVKHVMHDCGAALVQRRPA